jgi:colanic acid/amylovoran biosynthesis glycosyltransferase
VTVAYLVNRYPAVSHTFIRREIAAIEAAGVPVLRYSIRAVDAALPDPADADEIDKTQIVLSGVGKLMIGMILMKITHPIRVLRAAALAWSMARKAGRQRWRHLAYLVEAAWLVRDWKRQGVSHVHAHFGTNPAAVARLARAMGGPPYSFTVHGPDEFDAPGAIDLNGKIADAAFVVAISDYGRSQLMRWADWADWPKIAVVRCGLDADFLAAKTVPIPDSARLCYVGRLSAQKGLPVLIDAAATMSAAHPDLRVTVVGDGPLSPELQTRAKSLGIAHHFEFVGAASNADVRKHLAAARALVVPSFAEGLPVVIMEALALGRPVIATAIAGISELVDADDGWVVPAGNAEALAQAMHRVLDASVDGLETMGLAGRLRVAQRHDAAHNAAQLVALFEGHAVR